MQEVKAVGINSLKIDQQTIDTLEDLLGKAKTGELQSLVFVEKYHDGGIAHGWAGRPDNEMIGELEDLKFNILSMKYFPVRQED